MMSCTSRPVSRAAVRTAVRTAVRLPRAAAAAGARKLVSSSSRRNARVVITRASEEGGPNPIESALQSFIDAQPEEVADEDKGPIVYGLCFAAGAVIFPLRTRSLGVRGRRDKQYARKCAYGDAEGVSAHTFEVLRLPFSVMSGVLPNSKQRGPAPA